MAFPKRKTMQRRNLLLGSAGLLGILGPQSSPRTFARTPDSIDSATAYRASLPQRAFPGAFGGAAFATGGRGGRIFIVTTLADDGAPGTLRAALEATGPRTVLFATGGLIRLTRPLRIRNGDLTVAGESAPGDGITIRSHSVIIDADNVILRFLRFRLGAQDLAPHEADGADAVWGRRHRQILIDHCSMSWSTDECASFYDNVDFTMQWCILCESLTRSKHDKGAHGYAGIWGGERATFHHNLIAHHASRTPRLCGSRYTGTPERELVDIRNNVFFNWGPVNGGYAGEGGCCNFVANVYKPGPATAQNPKLLTRIFAPNADDGKNRNPAGLWGRFYLAGNFFDASSPVLTAQQRRAILRVNDNNLLGLHPQPESLLASPQEKKRLWQNLVSLHPFRVTADADEFTTSAATAYEEVLSYAGSSLVRDRIDREVVEDVRHGTARYTGSHGSTSGLIDDEQDAGGWPAVRTGIKATDAAPETMIRLLEQRLIHALACQDEINMAVSTCALEAALHSLAAPAMPIGWRT